MTPIQFIQQHTYTSIGVAWILSNMASALPAPTSNSSAFYKWAYAVSHATFGMLPRVIATMFPSAAQFLNISTLQAPESRVAAFASKAEADFNKVPVTTAEQPTSTVTKQP